MTRSFNSPRAGVQVEQLYPGDRVEISLTDLGARRLMLALGVNTARYGPEVSALLDGLAKVLGLPTSAFETSHPHGPSCPCGHCREVFRHGRDV